MSNIVISNAAKLAASLGLEGDPRELVETLKATAFRGQVSDAQMAALLIVSSQYKLNPWTKEIYAFPDKQNGIVPVVGVDGWSRIINAHPQFDGLDFEQDGESCTCIIYRKDRNHPIRVTEWMDECYRPAFKNQSGYEIKGPWQSHPRRMLRHKAMIQCARIAFGFVGIYDQDEAERIVEAPRDVTPQPARDAEIPSYPQGSFDRNFPTWEMAIKSGKKSAAAIIATVETKGLLTEAMKRQILDCETADDEAPSQPEHDAFIAEYEAADAEGAQQ